MTDSLRKTTTLRIEQDIKERLKNLADARNSSSHALMLEAIAEYVEREEKRSQYRKEAQKAWEHYRETGEHLSAADTLSWLETWGSENEKDAPACRK